MTWTPLRIRAYHYLDALNPWLADRYATWLLREGRQVTITPRGRFWVNPLSYFGRELLQRREHEPETAEMLTQYLRPGGVFVDVGANEGYFAVQGAILCGPTGMVWAVEPQSRCHDVIQKNCALNDVINVRLLPIAVSDRIGHVTLYLHAATNTGATSISKSGRLPMRRFDVECLTLTEILRANGIDRADLLKLDIESGEYAAILGSPAAFAQRRFKAIIVEYHSSMLRRRGLEPSTIHEFLLQQGYALDERFGGAELLHHHQGTLVYFAP